MLSREKVTSGNMDWRLRTSKVQTQIDLIFNKNNMFWLVTTYRYIKCLMDIKSHSRNILTKYSLRIKMILNKLQKDMINRRLNNEIFGFWEINNYRGEKFFLFKLLKYTLLLFRQSVTHKFLCLLYLPLFYSILLLRKMFLSFVLSIIALDKLLFIKGEWLPLTYFFLKGAYWSKIFIVGYQNISNILITTVY